MTVSGFSDHRKGHYLGTEIDEKWYKRFMKDKFFARGNGKYWYEDGSLYFRRYLTKTPLRIPLAKVKEVKIGNSHAGRWLFGKRVIKLIWEKEGVLLSSGFILSRDQLETERIMVDLKRLISEIKCDS